MKRTRGKLELISATLALTLCAMLGADVGAQEPGGADAKINELFARSMKAIKAVDTYEGEFLKRERIEDELKQEKMSFRFARPFKVYLKYIDPNPGQEVLYVRGANKNRIKAHKGSFPDITVNLSPYGRQAMKDSHQPIMTFGLQRQIQIMAKIHRRALEQGGASYAISDGGVLFGEPVWKIEARLPSTGRTVKAKDDENLWEFAKRVGQDMYVILHHNEDIDSPTDVRAEQKVFVPHYYASRGQYFIGKRSFMMIKAVSWDHEGRLYEVYEYPELVLNPGLEDRDFDHRNRDYDFVLINQR